VLYVTSFRHPVERVLSSYSYDQHKDGTNRTIREFVDFCEYMNLEKKPRYRKRGWVWACATNCYAKWFGGWPTPDKVPNLTKAIEVMNQFEYAFVVVYVFVVFAWTDYYFHDLTFSLPPIL